MFSKIDLFTRPVSWATIGTVSFGGGGAPKAPPPPSPPPTETSSDVQQESASERKRLIAKGGRASTILGQRTNPAEQGNKTLLGE